MSSNLQGLSSDNLRKYASSTTKFIKIESKQIKKQTTKAINEATKKIDEKIKGLDVLSGTVFQKINEPQKTEFKAYKEELKNLKAALGKTDHDSEKTMQLANEAIKKIEELNNKKQLQVSILPLKQRITNFNIHIGDKVKTTFFKFRDELTMQNPEENIIATLSLRNAVSRLGRATLIRDELIQQKGTNSLTEATTLLNEAAIHAVLLESQKPLNDLRNKLYDKLKVLENVELEQFPKKDEMIASINEQINKIESLHVNSVANDFSIKKASTFKSDAKELANEANKLLTNLSTIPAILIAETKQTLSASIETLKIKRKEIEDLNLPNIIAKELLVDIDSQIIKLEKHLKQNPKLLKKEALQFSKESENLIHPTRVYLEKLPLSLIEAKWSTVFREMRMKAREFKERKDIPNDTLNRAAIEIDKIHAELDAQGLNRSPLDMEGRTLDRHQKSLIALEKFSSRQNEIIKDVELTLKESGEVLAKIENIEAEIPVLQANNDAYKSVEESLAKAFEFKKEYENLKSELSTTFNPLPENLVLYLDLIEREIKDLIKAIPKEIDTESAQQFAAKVQDKEDNIILLFENLKDELITLKSQLNKSTRRLLEQTKEILKRLGENEGIVNKHLDEEGVRQLQTLNAKYEEIFLTTSDKNDTYDDLQKKLSAVKIFNQKVANFEILLVKKRASEHQKSIANRLKDYLQSPEVFENLPHNQIAEEVLIKKNEILNVLGQKGVNVLNKIIQDYRTFSEVAEKENNSLSDVEKNFKDMRDLNERLNEFNRRYEFNVKQSEQEIQELPKLRKETRHLHEESRKILETFSPEKIAEILGPRKSKQYLKLIDRHENLTALTAKENITPQEARHFFELVEKLNEDFEQFHLHFQEKENMQAITQLEREVSQLETLNSQDAVKLLEIKEIISLQHKEIGELLKNIITLETLDQNIPTIQSKRMDDIISTEALNELMNIVKDYRKLRNLINHPKASIAFMEKMLPTIERLKQRAKNFHEAYQAAEKKFSQI